MKSVLHHFLYGSADLFPFLRIITDPDVFGLVLIFEIPWKSKELLLN